MKKFLVLLFLVFSFSFINVIECKRTKSKLKRRHQHHKTQPLKDTDIEYLNKRRINKNVSAHQPRTNLKLVKGVIHVFLKSLGMKLKDIDSALRIPLENYSQIMRVLRALVKGKSSPKFASKIGLLLHEKYKNLAQYTHNLSKVKHAISNIRKYFHPTKVITRKKKTSDNSLTKGGRLSRRRRRLR